MPNTAKANSMIQRSKESQARAAKKQFAKDHSTELSIFATRKGACDAEIASVSKREYIPGPRRDKLFPTETHPYKMFNRMGAIEIVSSGNNKQRLANYERYLYYYARMKQEWGIEWNWTIWDVDCRTVTINIMYGFPFLPAIVSESEFVNNVTQADIYDMEYSDINGLPNELIHRLDRVEDAHAWEREARKLGRGYNFTY